MDTEEIRFDPLVGLGLQYMADLEEDASQILMTNGSRMKPAKRGAQKVSVDNHSGHFKYEPKGVRNRVDSERKRAERKRKILGCLQDAAKSIPMQKITALFAKHQKVTSYQSVYRLLEPLFPVLADNIDVILDEALADHGSAWVLDMDQNSRLCEKDLRTRLWDFKISQEK